MFLVLMFHQLEQNYMHLSKQHKQLEEYIHKQQSQQYELKDRELFYQRLME